MDVGDGGLHPLDDLRDVGLVVLVVEGIGLRHAHHVAGLDLAGGDEAEDFELTFALLDEFGVGFIPGGVALEDEELEAKTGAAFLDEIGRPGAEVLDAADLDFLGMNVDPVVGEAVFLRDDEGDGEEVAVVEEFADADPDVEQAESGDQAAYPALVGDVVDGGVG